MRYLRQGLVSSLFIFSSILAQEPTCIGIINDTEYKVIAHISYTTPMGARTSEQVNIATESGYLLPTNATINQIELRKQDDSIEDMFTLSIRKDSTDSTKTLIGLVESKSPSFTGFHDMGEHKHFIIRLRGQSNPQIGRILNVNLESGDPDRLKQSILRYQDYIKQKVLR